MAPLDRWVGILTVGFPRLNLIRGYDAFSHLRPNKKKRLTFD